MMSDNKTKEKPSKLQKFFKRLHFLEKTLYRVIFPYKRHGNLKKYEEGALILFGNHYSVLDVFYPCMVTDRPVHFMAKSELWNGKLSRWFANRCECIPVKRDGTDVQAVKTAMRYLKNGEVINIFPEGTRNKSYDDLLPFKGGVAALAIKTRTPILPVVQIEKVKPFHRIDVVYGEPIELSKYYGQKLSAEQVDKIDNELRDIIKNMRQAFIDKNNIKLKKL
jgi:1-acyl-sn-glycerol-3-phosphate acyltransferase